MEVRCETGEVVQLPDDPMVPVTDLDLHRGVLTRRDLRGRRFERCSFRNALFGLAQLDEVEFIDCILALAEFDGATLVRARFTGGLLNGASFHGANLAGSVFDSVDLSGAVFLGANLDGAQFAADPSPASLDGALYTTMTSWQEGFDPRGRNMRLVAESD